MNLDHFALSHICDNCPERVSATTDGHTGSWKDAVP